MISWEFYRALKVHSILAQFKVHISKILSSNLLLYMLYLVLFHSILSYFTVYYIFYLLYNDDSTLVGKHHHKYCRSGSGKENPIRHEGRWFVIKETKETLELS